MSHLNIKLRSLTVFRNLLKDPVIMALNKFLEQKNSGDEDLCIDSYCEFVSLLYASHTNNLTDYVSGIVNDDENVFIRCIGKGEKVPKHIENAVKQELLMLNRVCSLTPKILREGINWNGYLPEFDSYETDITASYFHRIENIGKYGYGIYSRYYMFYINDEKHIVPVCNPDNTRLEELIDYKREQQIIIDNTKALLSGKPAANILLTGDAGTGKSSTIKAVVNELHGEGLRILEVRKEQLREIPAILDELTVNPLKFILFIDDLSFQKDDDNYSALKAILEGSVSAKSQNVVIYATSNRRHLVKEKFSDREGDDIHRNDTMQEIISLSERFGIQITFQRPDKKTYLDIVHHLAEQHGIDMPREELEAGAERFTLSRGNRSARAAKQYIDSLIAAK